jgi:hypothetical protein
VFYFFYFFCASRLFWVSLCGAKLDFSVSLALQARFWWETFVGTKVLPPSPLSKELWVLGWELFYVFYHILLEIHNMQGYIIYCYICANFKLTRGTYAQHLLV